MRADLVARALRLIADGIIDSEGVAGLAKRLAVSERHLHRELVAGVGVGPLALARSRRAQTARILIDQTNLSLTDIAFAAGFASIRQFNETMHDIFGCPPSEFRRRAIATDGGNGKLTLRLHYRPPFDLDELLHFLSRRALPGVEAVQDKTYYRVIALPKTSGIISLTQQPEAHALLLRVQVDELRNLNMLVQRCRQLFDLDADPIAIERILGSDPLLGPLVTSRPGLRITGAFSGFEMAVRAILGQQVSVAGARTLAARLVVAVGTPLASPTPQLTHAFPSPETLATASLGGLGITQHRINAIHALSNAVASGLLSLDRGADRETTRATLLALPGFGPWTASYIAMRALGDPDAFPASDLGIRQALERLGVQGTPKSIEALAENWRPWRSYAAQHLWASLATNNG
jgi:AraC family transcriptional regulator, regulatory protein of adaptative response / DNA-3-methyladenine glycosylase II